MNTNARFEPDFDPRVAAWLAADPDHAPDWLAEEIVAALPSTDQRRAFGRTAWRMSPRLAVAAVALLLATVVAVAAVGADLLRRAQLSIDPNPPSPMPGMLRNGLIAVGRPEAIELIDPASGAAAARIPLEYSAANDPEWPLDMSWAPDGRRLAVAAPGGIWVVDVVDGSASRVRRCGSGPTACTVDWSPDGTQLALASGTRLWLVQVDDGNEVDLPTIGATVLQPSWSPDGRHIAYHVIEDVRLGQRRRLFVIDRDGRNEQELLGQQPGLGTWDPAWSPDGTQIAFIGSTDTNRCANGEPGCPGSQELHLMALRLGETQPQAIRTVGVCACVGFVPGLDWAPDGTRLAVVTIADGGPGGGVWMVQADGSRAEPLVKAWGSPAWQPLR